MPLSLDAKNIQRSFGALLTQVSPESLEVHKPRSDAATSLVPSLLDAIEVQGDVPAAVLSIQFAPESVDVQMLPSLPSLSDLATAANFVPSLLEAIEVQFAFPADFRSVKVAPESFEVNIAPGSKSHVVTAASFVPSLLNDKEAHWALPAT